jgi:hypothetical protein
MQVDFEGHSGSSIQIYDLEAGKRFRLDAMKKEVFVMDLAAESERWKGMLVLEHLRKVINPTGQHLEVGGVGCDEYTFDLQAPTRPSKGQVQSFMITVQFVFPR